MPLRRTFARLATAAAAATLAVSAAGASELRIYNWSDYIDDTIVPAFEAETGIDVTYDVYDSNEMLDARLKAGSSGYDVVVPTASFLERQIRSGIYRKLDKTKLSNLGNLWPEIMAKVAAYDPGNEYSVPYMWGTTGIGYNVARIAEAMPDAPVDSWDLVFDPEVVRNFADCGVMILDSSEDVLPAILNWLGRDPNSKAKEDFDAAADHMAKIRPYIQKFHSDEWKQALANGDICLAVGYSGDVFQYAAVAEEAGRGVEIAYVIPKEGAQLWFDVFAIPADAANVDEAHAFIDYMMRPEVIAKSTDYVAYANANSAATPLVDPEITGNPLIYPDAELLSRLFTVTSPTDPRTARDRERAWTRGKTGS